MFRIPFLALLLSLLAACAGLPDSVEAPRVTVANVVPSEIGLLEQRFRLTLRIQNPNNVSLPLEGVSFEVELNGKPFATGVSNRSLTIPALGEASMEVDAVSNITGILQQFAEMQRGGSSALRYRVKGKAHLSGHGALPFDHGGEVALPEFDAPRDKPAPPPAGQPGDGIRL